MNVFYWQGEPIELRPGETVAAALSRAGVRDLAGRHFCGIGQCQNCVVLDRNGRPFEACITPAVAGMRFVPILPVVAE